MTTWLDVGNGVRNLFLLSCMMQAFALGTLFVMLGLVSKKSRLASFLAGAASTPIVQYLYMLLLALIYPTAPTWVYVGVLPFVSALFMGVVVIKHIRSIRLLITKAWLFVKRVCHFDKPALICLIVALCLGIILLPVCIRHATNLYDVSGGDTGEYMALALTYTQERDLSTLLEKEETEGHFRAHSHFPSLELYFAYGLFHTTDAIGYPYDKAAFTAMGMLPFYLLCAYVALLLVFCKERKAYVLLGLILLNLVPGLYPSTAGAPRDLWRILALFWGILLLIGLTEKGSIKTYALKALAMFVLCFTVMSAHVVCFVVLPFIVIAWVCYRAFVGRDLRSLLRSVGLALFGALGTLVAFFGNLWCYFQWGQMSPWRLMTTYTTAPWYDMYMEMEYKLEETTTSLDFFSAKSNILMEYATPIGGWGFLLALVALGLGIGYLIWCKAKKRCLPKPSESSLSLLFFISVLTLFTLAPMTGLLDTKIYSFSGAFLKLQRYTLQWFMLANVMICAFLAFLHPLWSKAIPKLPTWIPSQNTFVKKAPLWLCAVLCVLGFVQGTKQSGYADTFYRFSRDVLEDETMLVDNQFVDQYGLLMTIADHVTDDQMMLITRAGYQYALDARGYVLTANPIVPLLNASLEEVPEMLLEMNVALLATQPEFWDERYYALSDLSTYLSSLPEEQIIQTDAMRIYLLDPSLVPIATQHLETLGV